MIARRISFVLAFALSIQFAHAQNQALLQKRQREEREKFEQTTRGIRELPGTFKLRDVFEVRANSNNGWILTTKMPATQNNQPMRLKVDGLDGVTVLSMSGSGKNKMPDMFTFTTTEFADLRAMQISTHLTFKYGALSMGRYAILLDGYHNVTLNEGNIFEDDFGRVAGRNAVQFSVQIGDSQGTSQTNIQYIAPDFATLRRQHPKEIDQYLRPILRQLQMESVLAADPMLAWQVFAEELKPDAATLKQVQALLPTLDSDSFQDRDRALQSLQQKGLPAAMVITHLDRAKLSDQQNMLLDTAMAAFQPQRGSELSKLRSDSDFLLDCLYTEDLAIRTAALEALQKKIGKPIKFDVTADFDTRRAAIDAMRGGDR